MAAAPVNRTPINDALLLHLASSIITAQHSQTEASATTHLPTQASVGWMESVDHQLATSSAPTTAAAASVGGTCQLTSHFATQSTI
jgi:hypothetical protein